MIAREAINTWFVLEFNDVSLVTESALDLSIPDNLAIFDGVCTDAKLLHTLTRQMGNNDKWSIYSSGPNMLIRFDVGIMITMNSYTGFSSKFSYGKEKSINLLKIALIGHGHLHFSKLCKGYKGRRRILFMLSM